MVREQLKTDPGIENLLALNGTVIEADLELQYFTLFPASRVEVTDGRPHGIKYSLTLHDRKNRRLIGFDNAHSIIDRRKGKFSRHRKLTKWGHEHLYRGAQKIIPYEFKTAEQLMSDFWAAVNEVIELGRQRD